MKIQPIPFTIALACLATNSVFALEPSLPIQPNPGLPEGIQATAGLNFLVPEGKPNYPTIYRADGMRKVHGDMPFFNTFGKESQLLAITPKFGVWDTRQNATPATWKVRYRVVAFASHAGEATFIHPTNGSFIQVNSVDKFSPQVVLEGGEVNIAPSKDEQWINKTIGVHPPTQRVGSGNSLQSRLKYPTSAGIGNPFTFRVSRKDATVSFQVQIMSVSKL